MRTKLYVLGAVLGAAPGLLPVVSTLWMSPMQEARQESKGGSSRKGRGARMDGSAPVGPGAGVAAPPDMFNGPSEGQPAGSKHPCELITVMQVPCDSTTSTCEYTYWQCPEQVKPLRA